VTPISGKFDFCRILADVGKGYPLSNKGHHRHKACYVWFISLDYPSTGLQYHVFLTPSDA
jgi:hypothetical protein